MLNRARLFCILGGNRSIKRGVLISYYVFERSAIHGKPREILIGRAALAHAAPGVAAMPDVDAMLVRTNSHDRRPVIVEKPRVDGALDIPERLSLPESAGKKKSITDRPAVA